MTLLLAIIVCLLLAAMSFQAATEFRRSPRRVFRAVGKQYHLKGWIALTAAIGFLLIWIFDR
jgi:hypothetical protein